MEGLPLHSRLRPVYDLKNRIQTLPFGMYLCGQSVMNSLSVSATHSFTVTSCCLLSTLQKYEKKIKIRQLHKIMNKLNYYYLKYNIAIQIILFKIIFKEMKKKSFVLNVEKKSTSCKHWRRWKMNKIDLHIGTYRFLYQIFWLSCCCYSCIIIPFTHALSSCPVLVQLWPVSSAECH